MSLSNHPGTLILHRHFIRKAMGLEIELDLTPEELLELWGAHKELHLNRIEMGEVRGYDQEHQPQEADVEVDGAPMNTNWAEPAWDSTKQAAVRKVMACLMNDAKSLPQIGRRVDRIVRQVGTADLYFDDGSFVSVQVTDPQPRTDQEAAVIEAVYGVKTPAKSCGCKKASCVHTAAPTIDMVAAVHRNQLLGAMDVRKHGAKDTRFWGYKVDGPFELYLLKDVPMDLARHLTDFPTRTSRLRNPKHAWGIIQEYVAGRTIKRVSR